MTIFRPRVPASQYAEQAASWLPEGIAVGAGQIFYTNPNSNDIFEVNLDGTGFKSFAIGGAASDIALLTSPAPTVPEPPTWAMMLIGFAGLGFAFRQSRRKASFA